MNFCCRFAAILTISLLSILPCAKDSLGEEAQAARKGSIRIVSFSIIDTRTQKPVEGYANIKKNLTIAISQLPTDKINVRANVSGRAGSVRFIVPEKKLNRVESKAPYSLAGDIYGRFLKWTAVPGTYTLKAIPYTSRAGRGALGEALQLKVRFTEKPSDEPIEPDTPEPASSPTS